MDENPYSPPKTSPTGLVREDSGKRVIYTLPNVARIIRAMLLGGLLGVAVGTILFHHPFGFPPSNDLEALICGLLGAYIGYWREISRLRKRNGQV